MVLNKPQSRIMRVLAEVARDITIAIAFGRGVGKSWFIRRVAYYLIAKWDGVAREAGGRTIYGVRIIFLMPTFKQFRDIHSRQMLQELSGEFAALDATVNRSTFTVEFPGGSWIQIFPASDHGSKRALGMRCDVVLLDECDDIEKAVYEVVVAPWFTEPWTLNIRIGSGTPRRGRHGLLYKLFSAGKFGAKVRAGEPVDLPELEREAYRGFYSFHATWRDAPGNVSEAAADAARITMAPNAFKREYECDFDSNEGLVYGDVWSEDFHVRIPPDDIVFREVIVGGDKGWEDPGCLLFGGLTGHGADASLWVFDEVYEQHKVLDWWCGRLAEKVGPYPGSALYHDPSAPDWIEAYRRKAPIKVREVDNSILEGIDAVANLFAIRQRGEERTARLFIHPRCKNLIRELNSYRRKADRVDPDRFTDEIVERDDHAPDCLRYMVAGHFGLRKGTSPRGYSRHETRQ
jgi:hypothetical protein